MSITKKPIVKIAKWNEPQEIFKQIEFPVTIHQLTHKLFVDEDGNFDTEFAVELRAEDDTILSIVCERRWTPDSKLMTLFEEVELAPCGDLLVEDIVFTNHRGGQKQMTFLNEYDVCQLSFVFPAYSGILISVMPPTQEKQYRILPKKGDSECEQQ